MTDIGKFRILYHDINSNLQSVIALLELSDLPDHKKYSRVKPYLLAINSLYASLTRNQPYEAEVNLKSYFLKFEQVFDLSLISTIKFNDQNININTAIKAKDAVYIGFFIYELIFLVHVDNQNLKNNDNCFIFTFQTKNDKLQFTFEGKSLKQSDLLLGIENQLKTFTLLKIIYQQLKLNHNFSDDLVKIEYKI
ncbi:hypothetical protein [Psychroflexus sp. ALD_RP9]|uniref:hypothetical protein n=1 Tax=Psychroflexus sp. ALD_RP9 TaxID=2777186 RepID=UPI001A8C71FA|nr:hypothetical protein [Psychroflexus sp. ALD_RP9]QSS96559.1 hypothetical protein IMZ30_08895 [Psychroflexus sp. ALD_RP9]